MFYVYIIYSPSLGSKYIGFTDNIKKRIHEHLDGKNRYTKKRDDWRLIYYEGFLDKTDALIEEKFLKSGKGYERIKYLLNHYFLHRGEVA